MAAADVEARLRRLRGEVEPASPVATTDPAPASGSDDQQARAEALAGRIKEIDELFTPEPTAFDPRALGAMGTSLAGSGLASAASAGLGMIHPALGAVSAPILQGLAGYGTRQGNIAMGWEQPGTVGDVLSVAGPAIPEVVRRAPVLLRHTAGGAGVLHQEAADRLTKLSSMINIPSPSDPMFEIVERSGVGIPLLTPNLAKAAAKARDIEVAAGRGAELGGIKEIADGILEDMTNQNGQLFLNQASVRLRRYGKLSGVLQDKSGEAAGAGESLYAALSKDIDEAIARGRNPKGYEYARPQTSDQTALKGTDLAITGEPTTAPLDMRAYGPSAAQELSASQLETLLMARNIFKREMGREELDRAVTAAINRGKGLGESTRTDRADVVNMHVIDKFVLTNKKFRESVTPAELDAIHGTIKTVLNLPPMPPERGRMFGSGALATRTGLTYGLTRLLAPDVPYLAEGLGGLAMAAPRILSTALMTPTGRNLLIKYAQQGGLGPGTITLLGAALAAQARGEDPVDIDFNRLTGGAP